MCDIIVTRSGGGGGGGGGAQLPPPIEWGALAPSTSPISATTESVCCLLNKKDEPFLVGYPKDYRMHFLTNQMLEIA